MIDGITFRSTSEGKAYQIIKDSGLPFDYESKVFELTPKIYMPDHNVVMERYGKKFMRRQLVSRMTYKPDFIIDNKYIIEWKGHDRPRFKVIWKLFKHHIVQHRLPYEIFKVKTQKELKEVLNYIKDERNGN